MTLKLDSKAGMKGEVTENGYHWGSPLRSYSNVGSPTLHSIWTMDGYLRKSVKSLLGLDY